jgi:hypothetical protein
LKTLEHHSKGNKGTVRSTAVEELSITMVHLDMDMFVLAGDFIALLERAALEPLSSQPLSPKDDKCSQSRAKVSIVVLPLFFNVRCRLVQF